MYVIEVVLTYGLLIGVNELYKLSVSLPYFLMITIYAFFDSFAPFKYEHLLIFVAYPLIIGNVFLSLEFLSYPFILVCYFSVAIYQSLNKFKNFLPIWMLLV